MDENKKNKKGGRVKAFFRGLVDKVDKKMEEKAKSSSCCCGPSGKKDSCCS